MFMYYSNPKMHCMLLYCWPYIDNSLYKLIKKYAVKWLKQTVTLVKYDEVSSKAYSQLRTTLFSQLDVINRYIIPPSRQQNLLNWKDANSRCFNVFSCLNWYSFEIYIVVFYSLCMPNPNPSLMQFIDRHNRSIDLCFLFSITGRNARYSQIISSEVND
jgi:hypothetical protein